MRVRKLVMMEMFIWGVVDTVTALAHSLLHRSMVALRKKKEEDSSGDEPRRKRATNEEKKKQVKKGKGSTTSTARSVPVHQAPAASTGLDCDWRVPRRTGRHQLYPLGSVAEQESSKGVRGSVVVGNQLTR